MAKSLPYMKWYPSDFDDDEDVRLMTDEQVGFYVRLLNYAWRQDGLPSDSATLANIFHKSPDEFDALWTVVGKKFNKHHRTGRLVNNRQEEEKKDAKLRSQRASNAVRKRYGRSTVVERANNERGSDESLRASDSVSVSVSESSGDGSREEPNADLPRLASAIDPKPYIPDGWEEFIETAAKVQMVLDPSPTSEACRVWRDLSMEDRLEAVDGIRKRVANGDYANTAYVPSAENYLRKRKWRESLRPPPGPAAKRKPETYMHKRLRELEAQKGKALA